MLLRVNSRPQQTETPYVKRIALVLAGAALTLGTASCGRDTALINKGSDTMLDVALAWSEQYFEVNPVNEVQVSGGGSSSGITGIIDGTVDIANCSREMKPKEIADARAKGHDPVKHHVGYDGIAVYVHKDNPIESITLQQLHDIYAENGPVTKWSDLGIKLPADVDDKIVLVSRQTNSGTFEYFREAVLGKEVNFRRGTRDLNGSKDVVDVVGNTRTAIGYSGLAYATAEVRMVPVRKTASDPPINPSIDTCLDRSYPISRPLFMYTVGEPHDAVRAYLDWIKSDDGQRVLLQQGYPPLRKL